MVSFESKYRPDNYMEKVEGKAENLETMRLPEIVIKEEKGLHLLSLIFKGSDSHWGNAESSLADLTNQYFIEHPLNPKIKEKIEILEREGVDEESFYNLALTYQHPERKQDIFDMLEKHKSIKRSEAEKLQQELAEALTILDNEPSLNKIEDIFQKETQEDIKKREEKLEESRERIEYLIKFFKPKAQTAKMEKVSILPTDFLYHKNSGKGFKLDKELMLMSPLEDAKEGQSHEFLHGIINPIVDKLDKNLSDDQRGKIIELTSGKLKKDYGQKVENAYSLLCEELIRTFNNYFNKGERPSTYDEFEQKVQKITHEQFQDFLKGDRRLREQCHELGITNIEGMRKKSREYYKKYEKDELREIIYSLYQDYADETTKDPKINFEDFLTDRLPKTLNI